jgi:hypothetical protein
MAIKVFGNKIVFPDNTEQTTASENVWTDNGDSAQFDGDGSSTTEVIAENNGKKARMVQKSNGLTYFLGDGGTFFGTQADEVVKLITNDEAQLAVSSNSINAFQPLTAPEFIGDGSKLTGLPESGVPEAPEDGETYARNNATWVSISDTSGIPDAPVDGLQYGRQDGEWTQVDAGGDAYTKAETNTLLDEKADKSTTYTKSEVDTSQGLQDTAIQANTDAIAALPAPVDTYTKAEIDAQQELQDNAIDANTGNISTNTGNIAQNTADISTNAGNIATNTTDIENNSTNISTNTGNISTNIADIATNTGNIATNTGNITSNTTAIGTLSGQVANNSEDIAELQNSIFFTSAYSADYPSSPNRDPEDGNMYLQNVALFTYSYAEATQIFVSKTDESGNVRQFTAIQAGDSIVLNEVASPNYGRYELITVEDVSDSYVVMNVIPKKGQGTVITGAKVAFQAFPKPDSESIWTDVDGDAVLETDGKKLTIDANVAELGQKARITTDTGTLELKAGSGGIADVTIADTGLTTVADITVNGIKVGRGAGDIVTNSTLGFNAFINNTSGENNTALGINTLRSSQVGIQNTAVGSGALDNSTSNNNTAIGYYSGTTLTTGQNNTLLGHDAQTSSPDVSNEVTIGNDDVTSTRLKGAVTNTHSSGGEVKLYDGAVTTTVTRSDISIAHHIFQDQNGQIGVIRSNNGSLYFDGLVTTFAQVEGLEAKLSAKDKLIEKLSARLDSLELKFKVLK